MQKENIVCKIMPYVIKYNQQYHKHCYRQLQALMFFNLLPHRSRKVFFPCPFHNISPIASHSKYFL